MQSVSSRRASSDASWIVLAFFVESAKAFQRGVAAVMSPRRTAILLVQKNMSPPTCLYAEQAQAA